MTISTLRTYSYVHVKGEPRPAESYRGYRRNAARGTVWKGVTPSAHRTPWGHSGTIKFWGMSQSDRAAFMRGKNFPRQS